MNRELAFTPTHKQRKYIRFALIMLIIISFTLRLLYLNQNPPALNQDEAMTGYNAYAISKTLKDHRGYFMPAQMHGFGNIGIVSPLYTYLTVPVVAVMGLHETSVRLPALILNVALLLIMFVFVAKLFNNEVLALIATALLSVNPWHFHFSRIGHEAVIVPFMLFTSGLLLIKALTEKKNTLLFIAAGLMTGLSFYTYQNTWVLTPVMFLFICLIYHEEVLHRRLHLLISISIILIVVFPLIYFYYGVPEPGRESYAAIVSIVNKPRPVLRYLRNYSTYFSPAFLFFKGDKTNMPGMNGTHGMFHKYLLILFPLGLIYLLRYLKRQRAFKREIMLVLGLLLLYPLVAAMADPSPHALRSYTLIPAFHIVAGGGLWFLVKLIQKLMARKIPGFVVTLIIIIPLLIFFITFLVQYYFVYPKSEASITYYQYGLLKACRYVAHVEKNYDSVYFTDRANQPFIYMLFATRPDPTLFSEDPGKIVDGMYFGKVHKYGKYSFIRPQHMPLSAPRTLYVTGGKDVLPGKTIVHTITDSHDHIRYIIWE